MTRRGARTLYQVAGVAVSAFGLGAMQILLVTQLAPVEARSTLWLASGCCLLGVIGSALPLVLPPNP